LLSADEAASADCKRLDACRQLGRGAVCPGIFDSDGIFQAGTRSAEKGKG